MLTTTPKPSTTLSIKDANGQTRNLGVDIIDGDNKHIPFHSIYGEVEVTASLNNPVGITGAVQINNFPQIQTVQTNVESPLTVNGNISVNNFPSQQLVYSTQESPIVCQKIAAVSVGEIVKNQYSWDTAASGTFQLAAADGGRKEIIIHNTGPGLLYVKLSGEDSNDASKHGFTLINTASAPSIYNFIIYPSGTYISSEPSRCLYYGGYFVSSSATGTVVTTTI